MDTFTSWRSGVTPAQMREVDRRAEAEYGLSTMVLMEVAGLACARVARTLLGGPIGGRAVCILAGPGNNGGDGLCAGRHLAGWGARVEALTSYPEAGARGSSAAQLDMATAAGVSVSPWDSTLPAAELIVDALLGFGATGEPRGAVAEMIGAGERGPVMAVDVPSGIDAETGETPGKAVRATATVTLALPKTGLLVAAAAPYVGRLFLADIGIPRPLLNSIGVDTSGLFEDDDIVELV